MPDVIDQLRSYGAAVEDRVGRTDLHQVVGGSRAMGPRRGHRAAIALAAAAAVCVAVVLAVANQPDGSTDLTTSPQPSRQSTDTTRLSEGAVDDVAGEIGPGGGVMYDGREMQSTPSELYSNQPDGETVVYDVADTEGYYVTAQRDGDRLCLRLRAAGKSDRPAAETCDAPAYAHPAEVTEATFLGSGTIRTAAGDVAIVFGLTYSDARTVATPDGTHSASLHTALPFWMHRFFALQAPADAGELVLLDGDGAEVDRVLVPRP